jgi:hypothetical protein
MGLRFQGVFYSEKDTQFAVNIFDVNYSGSAIAFSAENVEITYQGDEDRERFSSVIGSQCKVRMVINSNDLQQFIDDIVTVEEGDLVLQVQSSTLSGPVINWTGYILSDLISTEDRPLDVGYIADIIATDAIGVLKGIEYNSISGPYFGESTFVEILLKIINKLTGFDGIIDGSDANYKILRVVCNWHEDSYTYSSTINPLKRSRVSENAFYWVDSKENNRFYSCYQVLQFICTAWGARFFFSGTSFYFVQVNEMLSPSAKTVFTYTKTGTEVIESSQDFRRLHEFSKTNAEVIRFAGGYFNYFAPIKKVTVDYQHIQARNILVGRTFTQNSSQYTDFGFVTDNGGNTQISFASTLKYRTERNPFTGVAYFVTFRLKLIVGLYTLKGGIGATEWSTDVTEWYYITGDRIDQEFADLVNRIEFITPPLPLNTTGQIIFNFQAHKAFDELGNELTLSTSAGEVTYSFSLGPSYLEVLQTGNFDDQSDIYRYAAQSTKGSSREIEVQTRIGGGPNQVSPGAIQVLNNSSTWVQSAGWRVGNSGTYKEFGQLLANEIIRGQIYPVRKFLGTSFQNNKGLAKALLPHHVLNYNSGFWLFLSGTYDFQTEIFAGDWALLATSSDFTELTRELILEDEDGVESTVRSSVRTSGIGGIAVAGLLPGVRSVNVFKQEFIESYTRVLTVTRNSGILPDNEAQIDVYQSGQLMVDSQWSKTGTGEITIEEAAHWDGANYTVVFTYIE